MSFFMCSVIRVITDRQMEMTEQPSVYSSSGRSAGIVDLSITSAAFPNTVLPLHCSNRNPHGYVH